MPKHAKGRTAAPFQPKLPGCGGAESCCETGPTGCQRPRGKAAASVINAADALARYVCRSRCAAIGDGFGVWKIRRPAKSSPLPLAVEGESCRPSDARVGRFLPDCPGGHMPPGLLCML